MADGQVTRRTRYVRIPVFTQDTGYSDQAVREKIREGKWIEGQHYRRAPDGHILIDLDAYEKWVESPRAAA